MRITSGTHTISNNTIIGSFNGSGIDIGAANAHVTGNYIAHWETGIAGGVSQYVYGGINSQIKNNIITSNDIGIGIDFFFRSWFSNSYPNVICNNIISNNAVGIGLTATSQLDTPLNQLTINIAIANNNFQANTENIVSPMIVNATNNWWGTTDESAIAKTFIGTVRFVPFLTQPNLQAGQPNIPTQDSTPTSTPSSIPTQTLSPSTQTIPNPNPTAIPTISPTPSESAATYPTQEPTTPTTSPYTTTPTQSVVPSETSTPALNPTSTIPEFPFWVVLTLAVAVGFVLIAFKIRHHRR